MVASAPLWGLFMGLLPFPGPGRGGMARIPAYRYLETGGQFCPHFGENGLPTRQLSPVSKIGIAPGRGGGGRVGTPKTYPLTG